MSKAELITLKEYIDKTLGLQIAAIEVKIAALDKATLVAKESMERRLEGMNEFRDALKDQNATFVTRTEYERSICDIRELRDSKNKLEGKADQKAVNLATLLAAAALAIALIGLVMDLIP